MNPYNFKLFIDYLHTSKLTKENKFQVGCVTPFFFSKTNYIYQRDGRLSHRKSKLYSQGIDHEIVEKILQPGLHMPTRWLKPLRCCQN